MKNPLLTSLMLAALTFATSHSSFAMPQCPELGYIEQSIASPQLEKQKYRNGFNKLITWLPSFHMIHDQIVAEGNSVTITAKFDYGAIAHKDLEHENVKFYLRGAQDDEWQFIDSAITNSDGKASVSISGLRAGQYRIYAGVPHDGSGTQGYLTIVQPHTQAVLFDIDGTLTESDSEQLDDYTGIEYADPKSGARALVRTYLDLGYQPIFLTARVYWYAKGTREWLSWMGLPQGFLRTSLSNKTSLFKTAEYKTEQINYLQSQGIEIIRAYGNAKTDAEAFIEAGLGSDISFTIGKDAGHYGTTAILDNDYHSHINNIASQTTQANCE